MRSCESWPTMSKDIQPKEETRERGSPMKESDKPWRGPSEPDQKNKSKPDVEKWQDTTTH
jgi:hypothetical protein